MRRDRLWSGFEVSLVYFTQQGKYIFKIPLGFCFLLGLSSPSFPLWCQHVFPRFGLSHPWKSGDYRARRGWWGSPGCGESREGSKPLRMCGWEGFAGGTPVELSWECEFPSGADVLSSRPSRAASSQTAWQAQPEPSKWEIKRYQTLDLKRGKCGDFL